VTIYVADANGNEGFCVIDLIVRDSSQPMIFCPSNIVVNCQSPEGAVVTFNVPAQTQCGTPLATQCEPPSGSLFPPGTTIVNCATMNEGGLTGTCSFPVTVRCLKIERGSKPGTVVITWTGGGSLEASPAVPGNWQGVRGATSPFEFDTANQLQTFFRVNYEDY
jgi:hypothetical protein